ncbi:hypothetical protein BCON_0305g00010 [Botryotinia convoluta]|uniref:Cyanovirin-N domain-containing protein n=1 Tax=Botryotinia convoluta TaxID=54673 RepID=A0A4Z1HEM6_9HELO|nr:hypothetical protein BCON_0305g00010 [Botryotinia convoluta]
MLLTNINTVAIVLCAFFSTSSATQIIDIVKHSTTTCGGSGGPTRNYNSGDCYTFYDTDHGLVLKNMPRGCTLTTYAAKGCAGVTSHYGTDRLNQCISLQGRWSMKVVGC